MDEGVDPFERWTSNSLAGLVRGSKRRWWTRTAIPMAVEAGVLRQMGRGYIGRRSAILAFLAGKGCEQ